MINSFGTGKTTEADGSGRGTGKRTEAAAAVRLFGLFGCSGCSAVRAVRLFGLFGCSGCSAVRAVRAAAALLPRMASGERSEAPTAAGASSSRIQQLIFFLVLLFLRLSPSATAARAKSTVVMVVMVVVLVGHQRRGLSSPAWPSASGSEAPTEAGATATAAAAYLCAVVFLRLSPIGGSGEGKIHRCDGCVGGCAGRSSAARALLPRMASGERSEAPTEAGASSSRIQQLIFFLVLLFLRLSPSETAARALLPRMASGERSEAPTAKKLLFRLFVFVLCAIYY